ncbi:InlB B-repeat-containing protein [Candidatus Saccharibacteria bacterium]|nr:InlB B-repeat-containing protein [Candidatus Saccharibacteria bacterium]
MFSLHKKKRIMLSALATMAVILPVIVFAANRLMIADDTHAITYEMPEGYTAMVDPNFYDCVVAAYKSTYPAAIIPETGITDEQLLTIDKLVCNSRVDGEKITDTTGLEKMPRMAYIDLSSNNISAIDVSSFSNLTFLNLHSNQLTSIDVRNNYSLSNLYLNNNNLSSLNLSNNLYLRELDASNNNLSSLDLSNNTRLSSIKLEHNKLQYLNISNTSSWLRLLNINDNQIGFLDVSNNSNLTDLMADNIVLYAGIEPTISNGNYIYDLSGLKFIEDGEHEGFIVDFSITNTENYSYDEVDKILTVNNPEGAGLYIQIEGVDNRNEGSFTYKFGLPYILTYDLNGGSGSFEPALCYPNADTQVCTIEIVDGLPTRDGYNFMGWADTDDATTGEYAAGDTISLSNNQTIYAVWKSDITTVNLNFDLNGGEGDVSAQSCSFISTNPHCTVTIPNTTPTRAGYNFLGWANSETAIVADYQQGSSISLSQDKMVYAVWELVANTVSLSFNLNGGEGDVATQSCTVDINNPTCDATIPSVEPTRNGYNFIGWAESDTATSAAYNSGDNVTINSNKTLYAVWQIITTTISLNFDLNGGEGDVATQSCAIDVEHPSCNVTIPNTIPTRNGYNFLGWADSSSAITADYQPGGTVSLSGNKTIYAAWEIITASVSLTFVVGGEEEAVVARNCMIDIEHSTCDVTIPSTAPTKAGYNFLGWADSSSAVTADYQPGEIVTLSGNKVIYAVWELVINSVSLNFNMNGGGEVVVAQSCTVSVLQPTCSVTIPSVIPVREDYEFLGWADSVSATEAKYDAGSEVTLSGNRTIYAVWKSTKDDDDPSEDVPSGDESEDGESDDSTTPVPDTGVNTNNGGVGAVFTIATLPILISALYIVIRYSKKRA